MPIDDRCEGVDLIVLKPGKAEIIAAIYNERNPNDIINYKAFQIYRMTETCNGCPRVISVSEDEHYCLRDRNE